MLAADIAKVDADTRCAIQQLTQLGHGKAMTGVNADQRRMWLQERLDLGDELLREIVELRTKPRMHALARPHQLVSECGQSRSLAALGFHQRHAEECRPLLDQIPDMPIGELGIVGCARDLARPPDLAEHAEHHDDAVRVIILGEAPDRFDRDPQHQGLLMKTASCDRLQ
ncbi:hypothetical protein ACVIJ6_006371 [Bradyrhizobium sp. USDA 4369]